MHKSMLGVLAILAVSGWFLVAPRTDIATPDGYLVLALSWTPSWCAAQGSARGAARCEAGSGAGWLVHGLWPQHNAGGWPEFCETDHAMPSGAVLQEMVDIMGSAGLARHQWVKHGSCSGQDAQTYFAQTRAAFSGLIFPQTIRADAQPQRLAPDAALAEFRAANPQFGPDALTLICRSGMAHEIRVCLSHDLQPRRCDDGLLSRGCTARTVTLPPLP